jgi:hypothetical protein
VLIAFNKPFGVACKFSPQPGRKTLADYIDVRSVYPSGRLDTSLGASNAMEHSSWKQTLAMFVSILKVPIDGDRSRKA